MQAKFISLLQKLKRDPLTALTVINPSKPFKPLIINATNEVFVADYGSVENYFEELVSQGVTNVTVIERRQNGTSKKGTNYKEIEAFPINISPKQANPATSPDFVPPQPQAFSGLMGGLNQVDAVYKFMDHSRLQEENQTLKAKNEILEKDNKELREKCLRQEISGEKSSANADLIKSLAPLLAPVIGKLVDGGTGAATALAGPADASPLKQQLMAMVNAMDESSAHWFVLIGQGFANESFINDLGELLKKYQLINEDAHA